MAYQVGYVAGLSPLARGTLLLLYCIIPVRRFIPAGAGNTIFETWVLTSVTVYPRWRGEHAEPVNQDVLSCGLSPLARGTHIE